MCHKTITLSTQCKDNMTNTVFQGGWGKGRRNLEFFETNLLDMCVTIVERFLQFNLSL